MFLEVEPIPITREEIKSWYLLGDTMINETILKNAKFKKYAHVVGYYSFDVFHRPILRKNGLIVEIRYAYFNCYTGIFIIDEIKKDSYPVYESWNYFPNGRGFKLFLKHRAIKIQEQMSAGIIPKRINKSQIFDSERYYISKKFSDNEYDISTES